MSQYMELIVDGVLAILLAAGIYACLQVYRKLDTVRKGQTEMAHLVESLNNSILIAQRSIAEMKHVAADVEDRVTGEIKKARKLSDELSLIVQTGNNLADRIEKNATADKMADRQEALGASGVQNFSGMQVGPQQARQKPVIKKKQSEILTALERAR